MDASTTTEKEEETQKNASQSWNFLTSVINTGKKFVDISEKGIDFNFMGFSAGIGVIAEKDQKSLNGGLKGHVSTPWGSTASTGFQGNVGSTGLGGGLWARAALTPEIAAKAGLGGNIGTDYLNGGIIAGARTPITGEHVTDLSTDWKLRKNA